MKQGGASPIFGKKNTSRDWRLPMNQKPNDTLDNPQNTPLGLRSSAGYLSGHIRCSGESVIRRDDTPSGPSARGGYGRRPTHRCHRASEQMLVADPYWLEMYLEMMWNNGAVLVDTANPP